MISDTIKLAIAKEARKAHKMGQSRDEFLLCLRNLGFSRADEAFATAYWTRLVGWFA